MVAAVRGVFSGSVITTNRRKHGKGKGEDRGRVSEKDKRSRRTARDSVQAAFELGIEHGRFERNIDDLNSRSEAFNSGRKFEARRMTFELNESSFMDRLRFLFNPSTLKL